MATPEDRPLILETHLMRRAFFELADELEHCAETVIIPLTALTEVAGL